MQHHAICFVSDRTAGELLPDLLGTASTDTHLIAQPEFGIADARRLQQQATQKPLVSTVQTFVIAVQNLTHEAQNALLKLFEEPPTQTQFYLLVPKRGRLLPTLQSRLHFADTESAAEAGATESWQEFCHSSHKERLELAAKLSKEKDHDAIEQILFEAEKMADDRTDQGLLNAVLFVRDHIGNRGASTKMLLESLALALPKN